MKTACIIGGGIGGLTVGALLAREGYRVTLLEKNRTIGGGLQSFVRHHRHFDPCMHIAGGLQPGGNIWRILDYLGITDKVVAENYRDVIVYNGKHIVLPNGRDAWIEAVGEGRHKEELAAYVDALYRLVGTESLFSLQAHRSTTESSPLLSLSAKQLIELYISSDIIRRRLAYIAPLYGGTDDSPALLHALTTVLHIEGTYALVPSASSLANALAGVIAAAGGRVVSGTAVDSMVYTCNRVDAVCCGNECYSADCYVGAIPIKALIDIAPQPAFSTAFRRRMAAAPQSHSAFCLYGILKPDTMRQRNESYFISRTDADPWIPDDVDKQWPQSLYLMTRSDPANPLFADTMTIMAPMLYERVAQWEGSTAGHRPNDYCSWKELLAHQALTMAREAVGDFELEYLETSSPLTLRHYTGNCRGSCYGLHSSVNNMAATTMSPRTRMTNLFVAGQDVNFHGMVGTTLSSVLTAEAILGDNVIVGQLSQNRQTI